MTDLKKPLKRGVVSNVPHGVNPKIVVTLYPNGVISLREARRHMEYSISIGELYVKAVREAAYRERLERRKKRRRTK